MRWSCLPEIPDSVLRVLTTYLDFVFDPRNPLYCLLSKPAVFWQSSMSSFLTIDLGLYRMTEPRRIL